MGLIALSQRKVLYGCNGSSLGQWGASRYSNRPVFHDIWQATSSYDSALTVDPPGVQPGDSRTLEYAPSGALVERTLATQSTPRHSGSCTEFSRGCLPA